jgi:hypothetical protein
MDWYIVIKTIKGRRYRYRQKTWREGRHVRTRSEYLGPAGDAEIRFNGFRDLTLDTLERLKGKTTVSKQFISDLANSPDLKQFERELVRDALASEGDNVDVVQFAHHVRDGLLPLTVRVHEGCITTESARVARYRSVSLDNDLRGDAARYAERIFESPIETTAGEVHFSEAGVYKYFGRTRIEDMADGQTRRVIEVQSDLFQKGRLERVEMTYGLSEEEVPSALARGEKVFATEQEMGDFVVGRQIGSPEDCSTLYEGYVAEMSDPSKFNRLKPYRNIWYERMIREEIKQAAKDGKTKLQFPAGETAMKIEGLGGQEGGWRTVGRPGGNTTLSRAPEHLKTWNEIYGANSYWIITDVLGDGRFKAIPRHVEERAQRIKSGQLTEGDRLLLRNDNITKEQYIATRYSRIETFDISFAVDTSNPIYRFYEKEVGKYLTNNFGATRVSDDRGVEWWEVHVDRRLATRPVHAF